MQISAFQAYPGIAPSQGTLADSANAVGNAADDASASVLSVSEGGQRPGTDSSAGGSPDDSRYSSTAVPPTPDAANAVGKQNPDLQRQQQAEKKAVQAAEQAQLIAEQEQIEQLAERDREVRAHEQAHAAVGGQYAGSPVYDYTRGPNGRNYASSGHVKIDVSVIPGDPEATLQKAQTVRRAALAPAEPSSADRSVAAKASQMAVEARAEIARSRGQSGEDDKSEEGDATSGVDGAGATDADRAGRSERAEENLPDSRYQQRPTDLGSLLDTTV